MYNALTSLIHCSFLRCRVNTPAEWPYEADLDRTEVHIIKNEGLIFFRNGKQKHHI